MQPPTRPKPHACSRRLTAHVPAFALALAGMTVVFAPIDRAHAADSAPVLMPLAIAAPNPDKPAPDERVRFSSDRVSYDNNGDTVTASGNVVMHRAEQSLRADTVVWNRKTGAIIATGNIRFVNEDGDVLYTDSIELTDEFKAGASQDLLLVLREGGRLAARSSVRGPDGRLEMRDARFSGCDVVDDAGCPRHPSWELTTVRVTYNPANRQVRYYGATLRLFGIPVLPLPGLAHASDFHAVSGLLIPSFSLSSANGAQISNTFYWRLADNRDLSATGTLYTKSLPMLSAHYRQLTDNGAFQITGYITRSRQNDATGATTTTGTGDFNLRGYFEGNGRFQVGSGWSLDGSARYVSDRTFLLRYDLSADTRLRSTIDLDHIDQDSYFSLAGWAVQALGVNDINGQQPIALPRIDYRRRLAMPGVGGRLEVEVNSLALTRTGGQDTQRAFARAQWDLHTITGGGQDVTLTTLLRGDVYHSADNALTTNPAYQGLPGWQARGIATAAIDVKWPLIGAAFGGTQVLTPEIQIVASPHLRNLAVPNEDSRVFELEDDNIFALNRYPGYDRVEDGARITYGLDWRLNRPGWRLAAAVAQSYRLSEQTGLVPDGTGLAARMSDIVGRVEVRFRDSVQLTERFQLDKNTGQLRRNEFDATLGDHRTYAEIGYLALNRSIPTTYEDLQDGKELRGSGRVGFAKVWSVFGSAIVNLTTKADDPVNGNDGFQLIRHRLGLAYTDRCLDLAFTWRRDYVTTGDAVRGNSYMVSLAFKNIGTR